MTQQGNFTSLSVTNTSTLGGELISNKSTKINDTLQIGTGNIYYSTITSNEIELMLDSHNNIILKQLCIPK